MLNEFTKNLLLPKLFLIKQKFPDHPSLHLEKALDSELSKILLGLNIKPGARIAIGVGSRGITNLLHVVKLTIKILKEAGADPFIIPAMGSHGGATAGGQVKMLGKLGITSESTGVEVRGDMEVTPMGLTDDQVPMFMSTQALNSDGIVLINRVKAHTGFVGPIESGILKMMTIGLGNQVGADHYHHLSTVRDFSTIISSVGRTLIKKAPFLFGVAMVEDQKHQTVHLRVGNSRDMADLEKEMLVMANKLMPNLPVADADLLIIDEIGKNISGAGMDPCVVGRSCVLPPGAKSSFVPARVFIRDLTSASQGMAMGLGAADFVLSQLVDKIDMKATAINALTACAPEHLRVPLTLSNDKQALVAALMVLRPHKPEDLKLVHIKNSLDVECIALSEYYLPLIEKNESCDKIKNPEPAIFDQDDMLMSPLRQIQH